MVINRAARSYVQSSAQEVDGVRDKVIDLHRAVNDIAAELRCAEQGQLREAVRRAEEAAAALVRLEWALDRAVADDFDASTE
jgi:hypothetical protein